MKFDEFRSQQIYNKVYTSSRVGEFTKLLEDLTCALATYIRTYRKIRFLEDKRMQLELDIEYVKEEIEAIYDKIDKFFNEGFFQEITKEDADSINSEYQSLSEVMININSAIKSDTDWQKFTNLVETYQNIIVPKFISLDESIKVYNKKVVENNWKYKLRTYDEAKEYYSLNYDLLKKI